MLFIVFENVHTHHQIPGYATAIESCVARSLISQQCWVPGDVIHERYHCH